MCDPVVIAPLIVMVAVALWDRDCAPQVVMLGLPLPVVLCEA
jgi:hypothetical protein